MRLWLVPVLLSGLLAAAEPAGIAAQPARPAATTGAARPGKPGLVDRFWRTRTMGVVLGINLAAAIGNGAAALITRSPELGVAAATNFTLWSGGRAMRRAVLQEAPRPAPRKRAWGRPAAAP